MTLTDKYIIRTRTNIEKYLRNILHIDNDLPFIISSWLVENYTMIKRKSSRIDIRYD